MKVIFALASLVALSLPAAALAQSSNYDSRSGSGGYYSRLSYTYAELRLVSADYDGPGGSADGVSIGGSLLFQPQLFGVASYTSVGDNGVDIDTLDLGVGYRAGISQRTDLLGILGVVFSNVDTPGGSNDDSGISLTGGIRSTVAPQIELDGFVNYTELYGDGDMTLTGQGLLHVTPQLSLLTSLALSDIVNTVTIDGRCNFTTTR